METGLLIYLAATALIILAKAVDTIRALHE